MSTKTDNPYGWVCDTCGQQDAYDEQGHPIVESMIAEEDPVRWCPGPMVWDLSCGEPRCPGEGSDHCCGCVVHNSATRTFECGCTFFALLDDGVLADEADLLRVDEKSLNEPHRRMLAHWREHRVPAMA